MKRIFLCLLIPLFTFTILSGCNKDYSKEAQKFGKEFIQNIYTFKDTEKIIDSESKMNMAMSLMESIKPLMTERAYKTYIKNREILIPLEIAFKNRCTIEVENIELKETIKEKNKNIYYFNYCLLVKLIPLKENEESKSFKQGGSIYIYRDKKGYKIDTLCIDYTNKEYLKLLYNVK